MTPAPRLDLTAPSDGTLVVQVTWPIAQGRLELWLGDSLVSIAPSPIVATLPIVAGRTYRLRVADFAAWDYDAFSLSYVLTTAMQ